MDGHVKRAAFCVLASQRLMIPKNKILYVSYFAANSKTRSSGRSKLLRLSRLSLLHDSVPAQQLTDHEMADVLIRPITQMTGNGR